MWMDPSISGTALREKEKFYVGCGLVSPRYIVKLKKQCAIASSEHGELSIFFSLFSLLKGQLELEKKKERNPYCDVEDFDPRRSAHHT